MFRRRNSSFRTETYILCIILGSVENSSENSWIFNHKWRKHTTFWNDICVQFQSGCSNICFRCWHCWIVILMHKIHIFYQTHTHARSKLPHMHMEFGILWKPQNQSPTQVQWRSQDEKMVSKEKSPSQMYLHGKAAALKVFFSLVLFVLTMCLSWPVIKVVFIGLHY